MTLSVFVGHGKVKPLLYRHPWVFAGSIDRVDGAPADGDVVDVRAPDGRFLARGFWSGRSQIRVRLFAWEEAVEPDAAWFRARVAEAARYRRSVLGLPSDETDAWRAIHGEADGLPGVVADRLGQVVSLQVSTAGAERRREALLDAIEAELAPSAIVESDDEAIRAKEGLAPVARLQRGARPEGGRVVVRENGLRFEVDLDTEEGPREAPSPRATQKTGWFCDQRENRAAAARLARGRRVLDAFSYTGAFAIACARAGAAAVEAVESSAAAVAAARRNAALNEVEGRIGFPQDDVYRVLGAARREGRTWDLVILDPPKYARSRGDLGKALQKYAELCGLGVAVTAPGGVLVACTCSGLVDAESFDAVLREAARETGRAVRVMERRGQAPDHPVAITAPEGRYLQAVFCHVP